VVNTLALTAIIPALMAPSTRCHVTHDTCVVSDTATDGVIVSRLMVSVFGDRWMTVLEWSVGVMAVCMSTSMARTWA